MRVDRPTPFLRPLRSLFFAAGSVADALIAPFAVLFRPRHRVSREVLLASGLSPGRAFRHDVARVALRRRQRRLRMRLRRRGPKDLRGALTLRGVEGLQAAIAKGNGAIVLMTHGGPPLGVAAALKRLSIDALEVRTTDAPSSWDPPLRAVRFEPSEPALARARAVLVCLDELRRGGVVAIAFEGFSSRRNAGIAARGGPPVRVAGGAAALARRSKAAVVPAAGHVSAHGVLTMTFGEPLALPDPSAVDPAAFDVQMGEQANAAFERLLADAPAIRFERLVWAWRIASWEARIAAKRAARLEAAKAGHVPVQVP